MALRMVALSRAADGRWLARKGIPEDVREGYARLYRLKREEHLKLPADTPRHEAVLGWCQNSTSAGGAGAIAESW
jgi:hypothetical protein